MNSAHDSAVGCNSDITNSHVLHRFIVAKEIVTSYIDILVRKISETISMDSKVMLFNTLSYEVNKNVEVSINTKKPCFELLNKDGSKISFDVLGQIKHYSGSINRDKKDNDPKLYYYETNIKITKEMKPLSYEGIVVKETDNKLNEVN
jgi:mannosylglycerate hydrolase